MATFVLIANGLIGQTGLSVQLRPMADGSSIANGVGGDTLSEDGAKPGLFTATVAEALTGLHYYAVYKSGNAIWEGQVYCSGNTWVADDLTTVVSDETDLLTAIKAKTDLIATTTALEFDYINGTDLYSFIDSVKQIGPIAVVDSLGAPVALDTLDLSFIVNALDGTHIATIAVTGVGNEFYVTPTTAFNTVKRKFSWALRDADDGDEPLTYGLLHIIFAAQRAA